ncbi:winged helix-turn-helix domain-containing protein [uncultured Tateyamaria sp.]|uniref:winged helix-turn-helix domain-containing protein n=1 Tax=uncultured Tateyamaria sp. TaxID=455651 RepID=UPI00260D64FD|nr:winged helix-turn-helix domain-containing protein [uncultured Tateyamaria sp.]
MNGFAAAHIRLGDALYDVATDRIVTSCGEDILLRSQSALVLKYLVGALGTLATREELIAEVWPDVSVTDDSLTQCILDIRRAIGDADRVILKTVPKRGFVLTGTPVPEVIEPETARSAPLPASPLHPDNTPAQTGIIVPELDPRDVLPTLAVLPFRTQPDNGHGTLISAFVGDEIAAAISRSEDMNVISRLSTLNLSGGPNSLQNVGSMLNADFIISGSVFERDNKVLLLIEFAETDRQTVLWSDRMALDSVEWMHDTDTIDRIVTHIRRAIMINEVRRTRSTPLTDLKLFSVLHGAVGLMHRFSPGDFNRAQNYLEYVTEKAPEHPTPLAWLARWHVLRTVQGWAEDPRHEARAALDFTARALDIEPDHTMALVCEGQVLAHLQHRLDEAQARYDAALALNPNDAQGLALRGMFSAFRDMGAEGKRDTERALHLSPFHPHRFFFLAQAAAANIAAKDFGRAVTLAKESRRLNRTHVSTLRTLAIAQVGAGQLEDARDTGKELLRLHPNMRVSSWLRNSPSSGYELGRSAAEKLRSIGIPD